MSQVSHETTFLVEEGVCLFGLMRECHVRLLYKEEIPPLGNRHHLLSASQDWLCVKGLLGTAHWGIVRYLNHVSENQG